MRPSFLVPLLLLTSLAAAPATAASLRTQEGYIDGLTRADLDAVIHERQLCRGLVVLIDGLAEVFHAATEDRRTEEFRQRFGRAPADYSRDSGACSQAIGLLGEGSPQDVMLEEVAVLQNLYQALYAAMSAFAEARPVDEINGFIRQYEQALAEWVEWVDLAEGFWMGKYIADRERTCLVFEQDKAAALRSDLWRLAVQNPEARDEEVLRSVRAQILGLPEGLDQCETSTELQAVEVAIQREILATYDKVYTALEAGDDEAVRAAMQREQELASRAARCRAEHASGAVSTDCRARSR